MSSVDPPVPPTAGGPAGDGAATIDVSDNGRAATPPASAGRPGATTGTENGSRAPEGSRGLDGARALHGGAAGRGPAIEAIGISAGYGPQAVIHDIDLRVHPGEVVALLGANGAGKTTTLLALSGELPLLGGQVRLDGQGTKAPLHRRARQGLTFVTEEKSVFMGLSTRDNLRVAQVDVAEALALFPELERRIGVRGGLLSGGEQQMLSLARALSRHPHVLLADELSMGLAPLVVNRLLDAVRDAADTRGTAVLLVEQHVRKALQYADRVYVMRRGRIELAGTAAEMRDRLTEIEDRYLTGFAETTVSLPPAAKRASASPVVSCQGSRRQRTRARRGAMDRKKVLVQACPAWWATRPRGGSPGSRAGTWSASPAAHRPTSGQGRGRAAKEGRRRAVRWTCARST
jgi:branched-chain amino acid transport system ATP-binding protein